MILPLETTVDDSLVNVKFSNPAKLPMIDTSVGSDTFTVQVALCDDCGTPLVNGECPECTKQILL